MEQMQPIENQISPEIPAATAAKSNLALYIAIGTSVVAMTVVGVVGAMVVMNRPMQQDSVTSSQASVSVASSSEQNKKMENSQIFYLSGNTDVISSFRWDFVFSLPFNAVITSEEDSGASQVNKLIIKTSNSELEIKQSVYEVMPQYFPNAREKSFINQGLSTREISRVMLSENLHQYITGYQEGTICRTKPENGRPSTDETDYCGSGAILDTALVITCSTKSQSGLMECDDVVKEMSVTRTELN